MEFLNWAAFGTAAGAASAVTLLTQVAKQFFKGADPKLIALAISAVVNLGMCAASGGATAGGLAMAALNALLVAGASIGLFEGAKGAVRKRKKGGG